MGNDELIKIRPIYIYDGLCFK